MIHSPWHDPLYLYHHSFFLCFKYGSSLIIRSFHLFYFYVILWSITTHYISFYLRLFPYLLLSVISSNVSYQSHPVILLPCKLVYRLTSFFHLDLSRLTFNLPNYVYFRNPVTKRILRKVYTIKNNNEHYDLIR